MTRKTPPKLSHLEFRLQTFLAKKCSPQLLLEIKQMEVRSNECTLACLWMPVWKDTGCPQFHLPGGLDDGDIEND